VRPSDPAQSRVGHGPDHRRLTAELEAAGAEAERLREQEAAVENWAELSDVEQATFERLSELRRVIAGEAEGRSTRSGRLLGESLSSLFYIVRIRARRRNGCMLNWRWSAIAAS
jgi:DNA phosphorothioation-dependent restriction protein DptG